jgi:hypothetical protein
MISKFKTINSKLITRVKSVQAFLENPRSERGEESASVAAITALVLLIILIVMAIFRNALITAFERIAALLSF